MYEADRTTNTCACINAIPISKPEKATINKRGNKPKKKYINPLFIISYVNPDKIFKSIWPLKTFAANLRPSETFLAKYEINSINTNRGNKPKGQPDGTKREKNFKPCL